MPSRIFPFINGQIYHIYNRGTEKRTIFEGARDFQRLQKTIQYYQLQGPKPRFSVFPLTQSILPEQKIVEIIAFCLMPNHFHLLVKQVKDSGITEFISKLTNSYTKYYNIKYSRIGPLFQGEFKAVLVESDEQLIHVSRYIHLNPLSTFLVKKLETWPWSSYQEYVNNKHGFCSNQEVLNFFPKPHSYQQFLQDQVDYGQSLEIIKHQLLEEN